MRSSIMGRLSVAIVIATAVLVGPLAPTPPAKAAVTVVYVVPGGAGTQDGSSWANAKDLLPAAFYAVAGQQLWVKAGTYKPYILAGGIRYFNLWGGVEIYGGFDGTETDLSQRNWLANPTILDGNIGDPGVDTDNASHVVETYNANGSVLDGFTIKNGYANSGGLSYNYGAGMYLDGGNPQLSHLVITQNTAHYGGGMYVLNGTPTLTDVTISNNFAAEQGGGMWAHHAVLDGVEVTDNVASWQGGGIYSLSTLAIDSSTITGNEADGAGPIDFGEGGGGGLYVLGDLDLRNSGVSGNTAGGYGGGIYLRDGSNTHQMNIANVFVTGNVAQNGPHWSVSVAGLSPGSVVRI
ncbi:hypothetical protein F0U44_09195 [Nocardioides humilatus]|uniref:Right handed beta helix domain-containing protein n=1 Tax=Nocardioides humilatus TaxID=2607660 RepID=A0A5B1LD48_9ACTN|nr:hypothetical protein [Nocardioides humilatus]KAA1418663.1 hypothetical protein F0U44_09195 [Nocardioides humilatus]